MANVPVRSPRYYNVFGGESLMRDGAVLEMRNISKFFPGVKALQNVDFTLCEGEIHALMGENGAGKSTLMKCLFGIYAKDSGKILLKISMFAIPLVFIVAGYIIYLKKYKISETFYQEILHDLEARERK